MKKAHKIAGHQPKIPFFRYHPLACLLLFAIAPTQAEDYFDPSFLGVVGENTNVDLSAFSQAGGVAEGEYTVSVFVNQQDVGQFTLNFIKNAQGEIAPELTPAQLDTFGVNVPQIPVLKDLPNDEFISDLGALIPQATTRLDLSRLRLNISVPQVAMQSQVNRNADPSLWDDGIPALMANYNISAGRTTSRYDHGKKNQNTNVFASARLGANAGPWRLRSNLTHSRFEYSGSGNQSATTNTQTYFSNTTLSRDIRALRSTLLVGESSTGSDVFDGVPFKGVQLTSNEQMLPSQLRGYAPAISGVANSNARVTIRQNGNIVYEAYVAPGPFYINDIQQAGLSGDYDVTVTEADGSERQFVVPYSSLPVMLRPGGWKYEIASGRYDGGLTTSSRRSDFILGTAVYGLHNDVTVYGGALLAKDYQSLSAGAGVSLGDFGAVSTDVTHSSAKFTYSNQVASSSERKTGQSYRIRYSKSLMATGTSVDLTALRYSTEHFYNFSEFNSQGYRLEDGLSPWTLQRRRSSFQTQLSQQMQQYGSLHFRANRDDYWGSSRTLTGLSMGYSNSFKGISYGVNYNIDRVKDSHNNWPENRQLSFNLSVPFSVFTQNRDLQSIYATYSMSQDQNGRTQNNSGLSGNMMDGKLSYGASQSWGNKGQIANTNLNAGYQGNKGSVSAGYSYSNNSQSINMNASGGALLHSEGLTLSRSMGDSVALISAPGAEGVSVNGGTAVTDWRGYAVAPYLSDYNKNSIGLDPSTLPENVDLPQSNTNVYPTKGAVVKANFRTRIGYQVLMTLKQGAKYVPFGAIATLTSDNSAENISSIVGDAGQVYLTGLPETGELLVKWGEAAAQQCQVSFDLRYVDISADMPIRQVTYTCGTESRAEVVLPAKEPVSFASEIQTLDDLANEEKSPFSQWTNFG
ncbi:fimbria/pilus outer membrane usher protein [Providencia rustigianii]|uniref:Fimbrial usher protein n=1 Tax=Providencia rustigianii DSM 4541 TaxID=500637 RepID=D1P189_9GAMM|nr:fimbria/pilus outer membrane usher protein [Providencia rustigianii]EFB73108.1 fimbrial usher protein [Providencia rustigianii DSM 4541]SUC25155.1 Outer membrane usher protein fimD precursor [Providencia rustigianii]